MEMKTTGYGSTQGQYPPGPTPTGMTYPQGGYPEGNLSYQGVPQPPGAFQAPGPLPQGGMMSQYPPGGPQMGTVAGAPTFQGEVPQEMGQYNPEIQPPAPTAPPLDKMDTVTGYEHIGFNPDCLPPPSYDAAVDTPVPERGEIKDMFKLSEEEAREVLLQYVSENCCYGKGAATNLSFTELQPTNAFHYTLETFGESRQTSWAFEPYIGQVLDTPQNGVAPSPWNITPHPGPTMFQNGKVDLEVPHTASCKPCHNCSASGWVCCYHCHGRGQVMCKHCHGRGYRRTHRDGHWHSETCFWCHGCGHRRCDTCTGMGRVICPLCQSRQNVKCYIKLTVTWTNHVNDHIVERTDLPDHLIRGVSGKLAFEETHPRVRPINHFPDQEVNSASASLVSSHAGSFPHERILMQRHTVRVVPVTQAFYKWKNTQSDFFVYGFEKKVFAPNYPQTCCWGCSIL